MLGKRLVAGATLSIVSMMPAPASPAPAAAPVSGLEARVEHIRGLAASTSVSSVVRRAAAAADRGLPSVAATRASSPEEAISSVADALRWAETRLRTRGPATGRSLGEILAAIASGERAGLPAADPGVALEAAARMAAAIDAAIPVLRRAARAMPRGGAATGCDIVDRVPDLCVGGAGANVYTNEVALTIDLGGNDTYRHAAGAGSASPLDEHPDLRAATAVIDLAGDDVYDTPAQQPSSTIAQGATVAGVAMLVDLAGSDRYLAVARNTSYLAQGGAVIGGVGLLFDAAGNDRYEARAEAPNTQRNLNVQGTGALGGIGVLADAGGDDTYIAGMHAVPQMRVEEVVDDNEQPIGEREIAEYAHALVQGQGFGVFAATGLLNDAGGRDSFEMSATFEPLPADGPEVRGPHDTFEALVNGQGTGAFAGAGLLVTGSGDTTYVARAVAGPLPTDGRAPTAEATGQGYGGLLGAGVLADAGGADSYLLSAETSSVVHRRVRDGEDARDVVAINGAAWVTGQGGSVATAEGLLIDGGGADRYRGLASTRTGIFLDDERTSAEAESSAAAVARGATLLVQGAATNGGEGRLVDAGGDDDYSADTSVRASADGTAAPEGLMPVLDASASTAQTFAQGAASVNLLPGPGGHLADLGGRDRYAASASSREAMGGTERTASQRVHAQASVFGATPNILATLVDRDGGSGDTFTQVPALPACQGTRGSSVWVDCSSAAVGSNT